MQQSHPKNAWTWALLLPCLKPGPLSSGWKPSSLDWLSITTLTTARWSYLLATLLVPSIAVTQKSLQFPGGPRSPPTWLPFYPSCPEPLLTCPTPFRPSELSCRNPSARKPAFFPISPIPAEHEDLSSVIFTACSEFMSAPSPASLHNAKPLLSFLLSLWICELLEGRDCLIYLCVFKAQPNPQQMVHAQ